MVMMLINKEAMAKYNEVFIHMNSKKKFFAIIDFSFILIFCRKFMCSRGFYIDFRLSIVVCEMEARISKNYFVDSSQL